MIPSLEGFPTKAKEAPSRCEARPTPLDTNPVFHCFWGVVVSTLFLSQYRFICEKHSQGKWNWGNQTFTNTSLLKCSSNFKSICWGKLGEAINYQFSCIWLPDIVVSLKSNNFLYREQYRQKLEDKERGCWAESTRENKTTQDKVYLFLVHGLKQAENKPNQIGFSFGANDLDF